MIFCVEDDRGIRELVVYTLQNTGFSATGFECGTELFYALRTRKPELILLDIMLPDQDGIEILKKIRTDATQKKIPVIMLTAKSTEYDKVVGLDSGADDYIAKPFGMMELISRVRAVLRRTDGSGEDVEYSFGNVKMDAKAHSVTVGDIPVELTLKEFELLRLLIKNTGIVLNRDILLENIWGYDFDGETRTVDVHIRTLRTKLGSSGDIIETVRGVGYRIGGVK
jgi:two-component system, OmpR family, alkaline phosphatase synthesis response regulator PhoP